MQGATGINVEKVAFSDNQSAQISQIPQDFYKLKK